MVANQKKYTDEFRRETAGYAISTGRPITRVCEELGLNPKTVNDWALKRRRELGGEPDPRTEDRGLRGTKKRIRELEMGNAFLKKPRLPSPESRRDRPIRDDAGGKGELPRCLRQRQTEHWGVRNDMSPHARSISSSFYPELRKQDGLSYPAPRPASH